jgi:DNA polymerase III sliding clamp (beta) subunit (PCNA family)
VRINAASDLRSAAAIRKSSEVTDRMADKASRFRPSLNQMTNASSTLLEFEPPGAHRVLWEFEKSKFAMVATDGHRLARTVRNEKIPAADIKGHRAGQGAQTAQRRQTMATSRVSVNASTSCSTWAARSRTRACSGTVPDCRPVIPGNKNKMTVARGPGAGDERVSILANC